MVTEEPVLIHKSPPLVPPPSQINPLPVHPGLRSVLIPSEFLAKILSVFFCPIQVYFSFGATAPSGPGPPHSRGL